VTVPWRRLRRTALIALLIVGGFLMMVPFLWMVSTSLKTRAEVFATPPSLIPAQPRWENFGEMWSALPFGSFFLNSVKLAALNTAGQLVSCSMAAYAFARLHFTGKRWWFGIMLGTIMLPVHVIIVPPVCAGEPGWPSGRPPPAGRGTRIPAKTGMNYG